MAKSSSWSCHRRNITAAIALAWLSTPAIASTPQITPEAIALPTNLISQQPAAKRAQQLLEEGRQLYRQKTLESRQRAIAKWQEALPLFRAAGDKAGEALTLLGIGRVYNDLGEQQKALDYYHQSLPLWRQVGDKAGEATTLNNIGAVYDDLGEKHKALEYFNQSLPLSRQVGDKSQEASTLNNIGLVYSTLGEKQKALDYYNQSLPLRQQVGDKSGEATTLNNIGLVYSALGEKQKALDYYNQSLHLSQQVEDQAGEATTLNNIGGVYDALGEKQRALDYYQQSLPLRQQVGDRAGEARTLNNIGLVYSALGEKQKALDYYNQSLPLSHQVGDKAGEATTLNNIGLVYDALGEKQKALDYYNQSLPLSHQVGDKAGEARTLNNIGGVYDDLGEKHKALDYYNQSLHLSHQVGNKSQEATILGNLASLERSRGNLKAALTYINSAIDIIEDLRTKIANPDLRTSYFATVRGYYQLKTDILMQLHKQEPKQGYDAQALETSERSRARTLIELLTESNANIRQGVSPQLLERETTLRQQLSALETRRLQLLGGKYTPEQKAALEKEDAQLQDRYQQLQTQIRTSSPRYAALKYPQPLTLTQIQQLLDDNTVLLEYSLGEERSYLWVVTNTSIKSYELPKKADIEASARKFYSLLTDRRSFNFKPDELEQANQQLSQILIAPATEELGQKRLVIVSDGALAYIPFVTLYRPKSNEPLLVTREVVNLPSAGTLSSLREQVKGRKSAPKTIAVMADPVFTKDDDRLKPNTKPVPPNNNLDLELSQSSLERSATESGVEFARLTNTRTEAEEIVKLVPKNQFDLKLDFAANLTNINRPELSQYRIVHLATHGILNSANPTASGVVLSTIDQKGQPKNGFLRLRDIFNLNLPADLIVLSACQTGLGKEISGEGIVGLTRGFMYAGSPRVVVSLWSVDDAATAKLMKRFYQGLLSQGLTPAAALRQAQLEMHQQGLAPYYWAAFTIQGEWN
ncbi:MAG: tetratricopeptide repeat protein [Cyanosarcina radialis HA8281-LM2]|jgi:CHAT domain-containing protein|nr:tetratricopeptide repeat protein [Cyanosarcina radialis HA8281-LM2]